MGSFFEEPSAETRQLIDKLVKTYHEDMVQGIFESREMNFDRKVEQHCDILVINNME